MKVILKRTLISCVLILLILIGFLKINPPLAYGSVGTTSDQHSIIVALGNKHVFGSIRIQQVAINGTSQPSNIHLQVSDAGSGFIMSDLAATTNKRMSEDFSAIRLLPNSSPHAKEPVRSSPKHTIYGLSISENAPIQKIDVTYTYLGLTFQETIQI
ncbi:hypothetical protein [Halobacillus salinus]|uniref:Uncharacterized protein n=1 Tax=Halobacillus salinus TaxID=192814 RepID=A0A4Z0GVH0_9BACI|nr:hypothetical protein [Halobacillus salinus]TGB01233.1 hypothetical protein E4663_17310 [Halobacillus salinus]